MGRRRAQGLRRAASRRPPRADNRGSNADASRAMKKILIVEDQADVRKLIRMSLEFEDYEIHEASDAGLGLHMAASIGPDLMLLDVMMPGELDGLQVCRRVKTDPVTRHVKVVLLTARGRARDRDATGPAGADAYLVKPFSPLKLIDTIEKLLGPRDA
jgi:two-component system, OmpR family, phosphate regulon response regulator PhoB